MAKQKTENLFEESSQGAVSAITAFVFILSVALMLGGFVLIGYSFQVGLNGAELWMFAAGLAATTLGFLVPFGILPGTGK
jgi:hypothetical protein